MKICDYERICKDEGIKMQRNGKVRERDVKNPKRCLMIVIYKVKSVNQER